MAKNKEQESYYVVREDCDIIAGPISLDACKNFIENELDYDDNIESYKILKLFSSIVVTPRIVKFELNK